MTKTQIFDEVVSILLNDAACCKEEKGADAELYRKKIADEMDDEAFLYIMQSYTASFHVKGHLCFRSRTRGWLPFSVKCWQDTLYVCEAQAESPLHCGDRIIKVDGMSVAEYAALHADMLHGEPVERQGFSWGELLSFAKELTVAKRERSTQKIRVHLINKQDADSEKYFCRALNENVTYMRLKDFYDDIAIAKMYADNDELLRKCAYLIIDVRNNAGGYDSAFKPLLQFCLPEGMGVDTLKDDIFDAGIEFNYSARNCDGRITQFEKLLAQDVPADTRMLLENLVQQMKKNYGKGFIKYESIGDNSIPYIGGALPKKVFILTDENCRSSGDAFVDCMRKTPKVTVVGRPTMGIVDYSNCAFVDFGDWELVYPTSRSLYLDRGVQMRGRGVRVDVHIPWTPEHIDRDVDLETALNLITQEID